MTYGANCSTGGDAAATPASCKTDATTGAANTCVHDCPACQAGKCEAHGCGMGSCKTSDAAACKTADASAPAAPATCKTA